MLVGKPLLDYTNIFSPNDYKKNGKIITLACFSFNNYCCVSISAFASLVAIPVGVTSSAVGIKICAIIEGIKKYKSIEKKRRRSMMK